MPNSIRATSRKIRSFDGTQLYVETHQVVDEPVFDLVLVHGLTGDTSAFHWIINGLLVEKKLPIRCITFDLRGHGWSGVTLPIGSQNLMNVFAQDLKAVCEQYVTRPFFIAGQSLFGLIISEYLCFEKKPEPNQIVMISPAISSPPLSINRDWWFQVLVKASRTAKLHTKKRTPEDHLKHRGSFDYSPSRIYSDMVHIGLKNYCLYWLALFGSKCRSYEILNQPKIHYIYGKYDYIVPAYFQKKFLLQHPQVKGYQILGNHNAIVNSPQPIIDLMSQIFRQSLPA